MLSTIMPEQPDYSEIITPPDVWSSHSPQRADHIRTSRGLYNHHGIYVTDDEVIHFASDGDDNLLGTTNQIISTNLAAFLRGGDCDVKVYTDDELNDLYHPDEIVNYARSCLGVDGYNVFSNNCEHFTNYCTLGRHHSHQIEKIINPLKIGRKSKMGLLSTIGGFLGGLFGSGGNSRSSSNTTYEPDKVRVAEIERDRELMSIRLKKEAQLEIMQAQAQLEEAITQAKARGFEKAAMIMVKLNEELNRLAAERISLINGGHLEVVLQIENLYRDIEVKIRQDEKVDSQNLIELELEIEKFPADSPARARMGKRVEMLNEKMIESIYENIKRTRERQEQLLASCAETKNLVLEHTAQIIQSNMNYLQGGDYKTEVKVLENAQGNRKMLEGGE